LRLRKSANAEIASRTKESDGEIIQEDPIVHAEKHRECFQRFEASRWDVFPECPRQVPSNVVARYELEAYTPRRIPREEFHDLFEAPMTDIVTVVKKKIKRTPLTALEP
jgi:hypothetical protein